MDNATYHKGRPFDTPKGNWKKGDLYQACVKFMVPGVSATDLKATIWAALKKQSTSTSHLRKWHGLVDIMWCSRLQGYSWSCLHFYHYVCGGPRSS
ncbi:hypothetical protein H310_05521 [Aphanomyces invadans]|uniref:Tc1-like transposase DDE domain-containing protein n=1 Tax=Aphanomyces invadans TaxID=157072 RepID=A0A024UA52_9STRA|nr:hypothetical protein H310_05521 [Aphanomyces invadans]ETW03095.1 hypothetical protein H310_05521 [Aphanomyces invadans]|eukprot:XP_008868479.1 hypothetical protein H310_05521 [Aphanomyces invadans]